MTNTFSNIYVLAIALFAFTFVGCDAIPGLGGDNEEPVVDLYPVLIDGDWGYINSDGRIMVEPDFRWTGSFSEGLAPAQSGWQYGYVNPEGEFAIDDRYEWAGPFSEGLALVRFDGRYGFINKNGEFVINPVFTDGYAFSDGRAFVRTQDWYWEYVNKNGDVVRSEETPEFKEHGAPEFESGIALVTDHDGNWGFIDESTNPVIPLQYSSARSFAEGRAAIKISDRWGYIKSDQSTAISPQFISAGDFGDGLAPVRKDDNLWGYINTSGTVVIDSQFDQALTFNEGRAAVQQNGRWGYINTSGEMITEVVFDEVSPFKNGLARVVQFVDDDERLGYIDRSGKYVWYPTD